MNELEYRQLYRLSYSWVKKFMDDRLEFFRTFEQRDYFTGDPTESTSMGSLVDCLILEPHRFDEKYVLAVHKKPTGQMGDFVDMLFDVTKNSLSVDGEVTRSIEEMMEEAYQKVSFDNKGEKIAFKRVTLEKVIENFSNSSAEGYYMQLRRTIGRSVVDSDDLRKAEFIKRKVLENRFSFRFFDLDLDRYSAINQLIILFEYNGLEFKAMLDRVIFDHVKKKVIPLDLKTTYSVEGFDYNYLKYRYYIQASLYDIAIRHWGIENIPDWDNWIVEPMTFLAVDSNNYYDPLIYNCSHDNLIQGLKGFFDRSTGRNYVGIDEAVEDIKWHRETDIWTISRKNYQNRGICKIKLYDSYED